MATPEQKAFCVLQFVKHESVVSVQQAFRRQFNSDPASANSIRRLYHQFQTTGCLCKGKSAGRPHADQSVAGTGLSPRCVPYDQGCTQRTFVGMYRKLVQLFFYYYQYLRFCSPYL
jgi:hypothetical protein